MPNNIETVEKANKFMRELREQILDNKPARALLTHARLCKVLCDGLMANDATLGVAREITTNVVAPK